MSLNQILDRAQPRPRSFSWNNFAAAAATTVHTICFALWLGGLIFLGAVVAPNIAGLLQSHPEIAGDNALKNALLNSAIGNSFRILNYIVYVCGALMLLCDFLEARARDVDFKRRTVLRSLITVLLLLSVCFQGLALFPRMDAAQASGNMALFDKLHDLYLILGMIQMPVLFFVPLATAIRNWRSIK